MPGNIWRAPDRIIQERLESLEHLWKWRGVQGFKLRFTSLYNAGIPSYTVGHQSMTGVAEVFYCNNLNYILGSLFFFFLCSLHIALLRCFSKFLASRRQVRWWWKSRTNRIEQTIYQCLLCTPRTPSAIWVFYHWHESLRARVGLSQQEQLTSFFLALMRWGDRIYEWASKQYYNQDRIIRIGLTPQLVDIQSNPS